MTRDEGQKTYLGATISRRSMFAVPVLLGGLAAGCSPAEQRRAPEESTVLAPDRSPTPPSDLQDAEEYLFFSAEEARTVESMVARIIPGDDDDPGAIQAGAPFYIDRKLDDFEDFAEPTYHQAPFAAEFDEGEEPQSGPGSLPVPASELYRYGFQSELTHRELYRAGLAGLDRLSQTRFGSLFADLDDSMQDQLLVVLESVQDRSEGDGGNGDEDDGGGSTGQDNGESGAATDEEMDQAEDLFGDADPGAFFAAVRTDTIEGMFSDPMYGGNRNMVGWTLIGWPGAQRSYSPQEMLHGTDKPPTSMDGLTPMNPDRAGAGREALEQPRDGVHSH